VIGKRTRFLFTLSIFSPLGVLVFLIEAYFQHTHRGFEIFDVPYENALEIMFFAGLFAFALSLFSLIRDNRGIRTPRV
jgi:hypothetical protein